MRAIIFVQDMLRSKDMKQEEKDAMKKFLLMLIGKNQEEILKTLIKIKHEQIKIVKGIKI